MSKLRTFTRRAFMVGSVAVAGGVAFGYYKVKQPHDNPLLDDLSEDAAAITPWVKIDANGITLIAPHTDLGQGARSVQAALLAEELDVNLDQVQVSPGKPHAAYWNRSLANDSVPFWVRDQGFTAETMRGVMGLSLIHI